MQTSRSATLLKKDSKTGFFLAKFAKFRRTRVLKNICERLLLYKDHPPENSINCFPWTLTIVTYFSVYAICFIFQEQYLFWKTCIFKIMSTVKLFCLILELFFESCIIQFTVYFDAMTSFQNLLKEQIWDCMYRLHLGYL